MVGLKALPWGRARLLSCCPWLTPLTSTPHSASPISTALVARSSSTLSSRASSTSSASRASLTSSTSTAPPPSTSTSTSTATSFTSTTPPASTSTSGSSTAAAPSTSAAQPRPLLSRHVLRPYQLECVAASLQAFEAGLRRVVVNLPTGAGKTVVFSQLLQQVPAPSADQRRVLVLAHRTELLEQACVQIARHNPTLTVAMDAGTRRADLASCDVVAASVATLGRQDSARLRRYRPQDFKLIIIDEAHHAAANTYLRILEHFHCVPVEGSEVEPTVPAPLVWGCSATLHRADGRALSDVFEEIVYSKPLEEMMTEGWLAPVEAVRVTTQVDLDSVAIRLGDFVTGQLSAVINTPARNEFIVEQYKRLCQNARAATLVFCADIQHVESLQAAFLAAGIEACSITSRNTDTDRYLTLERFRSGELPVLLNCAVLTEGTDLPNVDCLILARPTRSRTLFVQMVGRGLRQHPGKKNCLIIDIADNFMHQSLRHEFLSLLGLRQEATDEEQEEEDPDADDTVAQSLFLMEGPVPPLDDDEDEEGEEEKPGAQALPSGIFRDLEVTVEELDPFAFRMATPKLMEVWLAGWLAEQLHVCAALRSEALGGMQHVMVEDGGSYALMLRGVGCLFLSFNTATKTYQAMMLPKSVKDPIKHIPMDATTPTQAFAALQTWLGRNHPTILRILVNTFKARPQQSLLPATMSQSRLLHQIAPHVDLEREQLSAAAASQMITRILTKRHVKRWKNRLKALLR